MRVPNPKLVRLASCARGAIMEPGDGELSVVPVLQPSIELSAPIDHLFIGQAGSAAAPASDSFFASAQLFRSGITGNINSTLAVFDQGAWSLDLSFNGMFTGTTNLVSINDGMLLLDPDANQGVIVFQPRINGAQTAWQGLYRFVFQRPGWQLSIFTTATVAADNLVIAGSVNARKSL